VEGFEERIYHVKFFWPDIRPTGFPVNETGYPAGYRISKKVGYPAGLISGATLVFFLSF